MGMLIFQKYLRVFNNVTVHQPGSDNDYVFKASLNGSCEKMKEYSARQLKKKILRESQITPPHVLRVLPALMDKQTSILHGPYDHEQIERSQPHQEPYLQDSNTMQATTPGNGFSSRL
jgi:hypothetical protein